MADSTSHLDLIVPGQFQDEVTMNQLFDAISPAMFGSRVEPRSNDLTWKFLGGRVFGFDVFGVSYGLDPATTTYVTCRLEDGQVAFSTDDTNWLNTDEFRRLYLIVTDTGGLASYEDHRMTRSGNV